MSGVPPALDAALDVHALVASFDSGRAVVDDHGRVVLRAASLAPLSRLRLASSWLHSALGVAHADIDVGEPVVIGNEHAQIVLRESQAWSSAIVLPLLNLVLEKRLLFVGAPGRGKTTIATLMGVLTGTPLAEVRRHTQHGHPQLTIADLLGGPLPKDLVEADDARNIRVGWRGWITSRVKIIDEYNRIPTKTQSALLSLMSEGYAESFEQTIQAGPSSWYLTANDELGGGTFQVIEALRDRIDVVVRAPVAHEAQVHALAERARGAKAPEELVPQSVILSAADLDAVRAIVHAVDVPVDVAAALGAFAAQLDFCRRASSQVEAMNKDTLHVSGARVAAVCTEDCPLDKNEHLCSQTENGLSARALTATLAFARGLAALRGKDTVGVGDVAAVLPFTLLERLRPNASSAFFQKAEHGAFLFDRVAWIRRLFERSLLQQAQAKSARAPSAAAREAALVHIESTPAHEVRARMRRVEQQLAENLQRQELNGLTHIDLVALRAAHARLRQRLAELEAR